MMLNIHYRKRNYFFYKFSTLSNCVLTDSPTSYESSTLIWYFATSGLNSGVSRNVRNK